METVQEDIDYYYPSEQNFVSNITIIETNDDATDYGLIFMGIFLTLIIFMSVAGNILVCVAIYTDRGLRRIGNLFLASLAIADLFVGALVMTFALVNDLSGYWMFGKQFCDTWIAFDVMCSTASILNLCAISLDRYIHIKDPLRYSRWINKRIAFATIAGVWLLAALISFLPISLELHRPPESEDLQDEEYPTCALDLTPTYAVVSSCVSFYIPCIVMVAIYCKLYLYAQKHVRNIRAVTRPLTCGTQTTMTALHHHQGSSPYHVSDHKAAITVGVIMGIFLLCWVPFFCVNIIAAFCKQCIPGMVFKVLTWLGYSNSAFNPIIYSIFNTEFREAFRRILTAHYPDCCCKGYQNVSADMSVRRTARISEDSIVQHGILKHNGGVVEFNTASARSSIASLRQHRLSSTEKVIIETEDKTSII